MKPNSRAIDPCFAETAPPEKAEDVLSRVGAIQLSERDYQLFGKAINGQARPTEKLRKAAAAYKKLRAEDPASNW